MSKPTLHEDWIDPLAAKIVHTLCQSGFETYLVGGCVRDLLVGIHPKDFDIATNATPEQVKRKIPGSYLIGRRFRLVLVKRGDQQFEVATFRRNATEEELASEDVSPDNFYGTAEEDARRRDFTLNGLFFDLVNHKVIDYVDGLKDIESGTVRMIGDPVERLREDPIRILRAVRLAHKVGFILDPKLREGISQTAGELLRSVLPRRREEYLKILRLQDPHLVFLELFDLGVLEWILPALHKVYADEEKREIFRAYLEQVPSSGLSQHEPRELFSGLLYAFIKAHFRENPVSHDELLSNSDFNRLMKEELGMFKAEMGSFFSALRFAEMLGRTQQFLKRGNKRQLNFLRHEGVALAVKLSGMDASFPHSLLWFWRQQLSRV
ncbi:MAG: poly(A) polymerase [Bdellovibrionaceae bacterium]|nr:poly(A) polymerase [Pseudobdellovibrionaceae bacterium]